MEFSEVLIGSPVDNETATRWRKGIHKKLLGIVYYEGNLMSIGQSGRIVIEIDPDLKKRLYSALAMEGTSLKEWFISNVEIYVNEKKNSAYYKPHSNE